MTFLLVTAYIVVVGVWILNHFYQGNVKRELEYKKRRAAELAAEREAEQAGEHA